MAYTKIRQVEQVMPSDTYTDTTAPGSGMVSDPSSIEDDLNNLRSMIKRHMYYTTSGNWYDDVPTYDSKTRGLADLGFYLDALEEHKLLFRAQLLVGVTVPSAQNWVVLNVAGGEAPTETAAVGAGTTNGALVAALASGAIGSWSSAAITGMNATNPKNLVILHDAATADPIMDGTNEVHGLLQSQFGVVDGDTFDDATKKVQISFVKENPTGTALIAANVSAIQGKTIHYAYVDRISLSNVPEQAFLVGSFTDQSASVDVTLTNALANQSGPAPQYQNIEWRIDDTKTLQFETSDGGVNILKIAPNVAGDEVDFVADTWKVTNTNTAEFTNGIKADTGGTTIKVGETAGQIDSAGALALLSGGGANLTVNGAGKVVFVDGYESGSTYSGSMYFAASSNEWSNYVTEYGSVSLLNALVQAGNKAAMPRADGVATSNISANTNVTGAGGSPNIDAQLLDYSGLTFVSDVDVYLNGILLRCGANSGANFDVYPGTSASNGDLKFEFNLKGTGANKDRITMILRNKAG